MAFLFLVSFIGGMLWGVRVMLVGVERPRELSPTGERSFRISPPIIVSFAVVFGIVGYLVSRRTVSPAVTVAIAAGVGLMAAVTAARLVSRWWSVTPEHDVEEAYVLQGHPARIVKAINGAAEGEVAFEVGTEKRIMRARSLDDVAVAAGTEVVIERVENDIAYVEPWLEVEKRL